MRIILGITGASGAALGYEFLVALKGFEDVETHLVVTQSARETFEYELPHKLDTLSALADAVYDDADLGAAISSGSFETEGMIVAPCSMKSLSAIANGYATNLVTRAADVCLKEERRVVLLPREMPLSRIHINNMLLCKDAGCVILPPVLTFYHHPTSIEDMVHHIIGKTLMHFGLALPDFKPWK